MQTHSRESRLINLLLNANGYLTADELANQLLVSAKTVYRIIDRLNQGVPSGRLITSTKGLGFRLNYSIYLKEGKTKNKGPDEVVSSAERQGMILDKLLENAPRAFRVHDLFEPYYVSDSQMEVDIQAIRKMLTVYDLQLQRQNLRLTIVGHEREIRRALQDRFISSGLIDLDTLTPESQLLDPSATAFAIQQLRNIEEETGGTVPYPYNVNIVSHLYILITRNQVVQQAGDSTAAFSMDSDVINNHPALYGIAAKILGHVESYVGHTLPLNESYYLMQYLLASRLAFKRTKKPQKSALDSLVERVTRSFVDGVSRASEQPIQDDRLATDLESHIRPMLTRLNNRIMVHNVLLRDIQEEYPSLFKSVQQTAEKISRQYHLPEISSDEIGFITLYFARYFEEHKPGLNTLVVCTSGLATSKLLVTKLRTTFPELLIQGTSAKKDVGRHIQRLGPIDLIISTIDLENVNHIPVIVVSALLTDRDRERVQNTINRLEGSEQMLSDVTNTALIQLSVDAKDWEDAIRQSAQPLVTQGYVSAGYVEDMVQTTRESGPYIVISKGVALPHARPESGAQKVGIAIATLTKPIPFGNKANDPVRFVFALSATDSRTHLRALSELVDFIGDRDFLQALQNATAPEQVYDLIKRYEERHDFNG